jgi:hypothetical protein
VKRVFLLNAVFATAIMDLISRVHLTRFVIVLLKCEKFIVKGTKLDIKVEVLNRNFIDVTDSQHEERLACNLANN